MLDRVSDLYLACDDEWRLTLVNARAAEYLRLLGPERGGVLTPWGRGWVWGDNIVFTVLAGRPDAPRSIIIAVPAEVCRSSL